MTTKLILRGLAVNVARVVIAATFVLAGFVKLDDPMGTAYKISEYLTAFNLDFVLPNKTLLLAFVVIFSTYELYLGLAILLAVNKRTTSALILLTTFAFTLLTFYLFLTDPIPDCGCFGDVILLSNSQTFVKNLILLSLSYLVFRYNKDMPDLITKRSEWIIRLYTITYSVLFACYSLYYLPPLDFLKYKIGNDISNGDANFFGIDLKDGSDKTNELLSGYTIVLTSDEISQASDSEMERINILSAYANRNNLTMVMLTATDNEEKIEQWRDLTGAEYPILWSDADEIKSMVRSNPGLMILNDGVVINKFSHINIPDNVDFELPPHKQTWITSDKGNNNEIAIKIIIWFVMPLLLFISFDRMYSYFIRRTNKFKIS